MRRLPLYCEVGPTILLTTAGEEINFATREGVSSLFVFCVCVLFGVPSTTVACVYCVFSAPLLVRYSARCCCVLFLVCSGVSESEREVARSS